MRCLILMSASVQEGLCQCKFIFSKKNGRLIDDQANKNVGLGTYCFPYTNFRFDYPLMSVQCSF